MTPDILQDSARVAKKTLFLIEQGEKSVQDLPKDKFDPTQILIPSNTR